jgi:hypothetical protein
MGDTQNVPDVETAMGALNCTAPLGWVTIVSVPVDPAVKPAPPIDNGLSTLGELPDPPLPAQFNWS